GISTRIRPADDLAEYPKGKSIEIGLEKYGSVVVRFWDESLRHHMAEAVQKLSEPLGEIGYKVAASNSAIDITPMDKGQALNKLIGIIAKETGEQIPLERIVVGGDSQNDYAMLAVKGVRAVYLGEKSKDQLSQDVGNNIYLSQIKGPEGLLELFKNGNFNPGTNASFGEGVLFRHMQVDSIIAAFPKFIIKAGKFYEMLPHEEILPYDDGPNAEKVFKALDRLDNQSQEDITIIEVDLPMRLLLAGKAKDKKPYYQLTHLGLSRRIIYLPKRLLDEIDINSEKDILMLATVFNHDLYELNFLSSPENEDKCRTTAGLEELIAIAHKQAKDNDPFGLMKELEERLLDCVENNPSTEKLIAVVARKFEQHLKRKLKEVMAQSITPGTYDNLSRQIIKLGNMYEFLGEHEKALEQYRSALNSFSALQVKDIGGLLPLTTQLSVIGLMAKTGDYTGVEREYINFLKGRISGRQLYDVEKDSFVIFMEDASVHLDQVAYLLYRQAQDSGSSKNEGTVLELIERLTILTQEFM
ncbi:MAG: hypothetical protein FJZ15_07895, partial [Candidatus Omnitrophica bacterium]|nr:hypothetical protein [Candidatus Omnitrophota bacterium]